MPTYEAWGIRLETADEIPGLRSTDESADALIQVGPVPDSLGDNAATGPLFEAIPGKFLLRIPDVATFLIEKNGITYQPVEGAADDALELYLMGSAMGALLHLRGILPIHASAVDFDGRAVLFAGASGMGKSTTAYAFGQAGHPVLTDDVAGLKMLDGRPVVMPGLERQKLWKDALGRLGDEAKGIDRVREDMEKFYVGQPLGTRSPVPLDRMYVLRPRPEDGVEIVDLTGAQKFMALQRNVYRRHFMDALGTHGESFGVLAKVAKTAPIKRILRPNHGFSLPEVMSAIRRDL